MITTPYHVVVVSQLGTPPTNEQFNWMARTLRMLVKSARNLGLAEGVRVSVYPMGPQWRYELPPWAKSWTRPEGCHIDPLDVPDWAVWGSSGSRSPGVVMTTCSSMRTMADEVWCLNALGHGQYGNSAPCAVWRAAQGFGQVPVARRFKLVPSWVNSDEPVKPERKEKRNAERNVPDKAAPARKAGDFSRRSTGSGKWGGGTGRW